MAGHLVLLSVLDRRVSLQVLRKALPGGAFFAVNMVLFVVSIRMTSVANATIIGALQPAIVLLVAGRWFGERVGTREVVWTLVAIAGVALVVLGSTTAPSWSPLGDLLAVGAVLTFTGYFLVSKRLRTDDIGTIEYLTAVQLIAAIVVTPFAVIPDGVEVPTGSDWAWLAVLIFVTGMGGQIVVTWAHRYVDVSLSSLMLLGVPVVAAPSAWAILGESLGPLQVVGGVVTLAGIAAVLLRSQAKQPEIDPVADVGVPH
jgi:drug/metabolite transporter (DMT)-like permease